jgi:hypothetical protein
LELTHDELLAKIDSLSCCSGAHELALKAVMEEHTPWIYTNFRGQEIPFCRGCPRGIEDGFADYPCPTIQAIEKELG